MKCFICKFSYYAVLYMQVSVLCSALYASFRIMQCFICKFPNYAVLYMQVSRVAQAEARALIARFDLNGSGGLGLSEFVKLLGAAASHSGL